MKELWNGPTIGYEPRYDDVFSRGSLMMKDCTWSGDGWEAIGKSYFETSYIHAGLSGPQTTY